MTHCWHFCTKLKGSISTILMGIFCVLILNVICINSTTAAEPYLKFLEGLRERQYYDTAMVYLQTLEERPDVPQDIKQILPYERALTLLASSAYVQSPEAQTEQLDQAQAFLEKFLKDTPQHELAARANTELANIMLGKARVLIWQSQSPSNIENRAKFQQDARALITSGRAIYQKALDSYKMLWESFGVFIPEDEKEKRAQRETAEGLYMRAQLDLATCTYEEAQTYDKGSEKFLELLRKASLEFEDVHTKYRSQYAGLFARTMQGKCFEEQDDIRKAIGIYDELLGHPGNSAGLKRLQSQVRHFRLICLNHETRKDYQLVIMEADEWLKANRAFSRSTTGLGIRWEMAQAQEKLAMDRTTVESDKTRLLRQALENAREINKYAGPYKDVSNSMIQRVLVALDREPGDPKDFDSAFGTANSLLEQIGKLREQLKAAEKTGNKEEIAKVEGELQAVLSETERLYRLALNLVTPAVDISQINATRYRLAYMFYLQRKSFETAVVGDYVASRAMNSDPTMALDGAYLAMAGLMQAVNDAPKDQKKAILNMMVETCEGIATNWPNSDRATDARMEMGRIYRLYEEPLEAAKWYSQVPDTVPQYATAQLEAGQAYWNAYLNAIVKENSEATPQELKEWQNQAAKFLASGIAERQKGLPENRESPPELIRAKVSLSQIEIMRGNDAKAVEYLTVEPHSVVKAVAVEEGKPRPKEESNVKSTTFASFAFQQLLRAYIGTKQLDKAEEARSQLEKVAGQSGGEALTAVYVELGRELQNELERLRKQGDQKRLADVRSGFESFLTTLFNRKSGQNYSSLIWIAETYFGLAEGTSEEPQKAKQYYASASKTYQEIINRGKNDTKFIDPARLTGVRLRLVNCQIEEGDFSSAEENVKIVLAENPKALDAQIAAADVYQAWGNADGEPEKFLTAVRGKEEDGASIWGWGNIGKRLLMIIDGGSAPPEYIERNREVQYHLAQSRVQYADFASAEKDRLEQLERAKADIITFARLSPDLVDTPWWEKFDELFQQAQTNLGQVAVPLEKPDPQSLLAQGNNTKSNYDSGEANAIPVVADKPPAKPPEPQSQLGNYILMGVVGLFGLGIIGYTLKSSKKPVRRSTAEMVATMPKTMEEPRRKSKSTDPASAEPPRKSKPNDQPVDPQLAAKKAAAKKAAAQKAAAQQKADPTAGKTRPAGEQPRKRKLTPEEAAKLKARKRPPTAE
ncbi:hypothetical protein [Rubinisphaera sp.]|uniref:tetratricopeptide repeat protein n=2 Tax=Rubinisphaera TaxID=1649490 RepID=UPI000C0C8FB1|nr:hypothetical protein [Rubinisphaera sp.]MBV08187.1 hypothetical protein [Rubinisphaera sp.]